MRNLMKAVKHIADYVVIDSPPTSIMADAEILAEYADVSILVVRQGMATARHINDAIDILEDGSSELLGCVYNDVKTGVFSGKRVFGKYGYGGYRYGYGKYDHAKTEYQSYGNPLMDMPMEELELYEEQV